MGRFDALTQREDTPENTAPAPAASPPTPEKQPILQTKKKSHQEKKPVPSPQKEVSHDTVIPRHHDTMIPRNHETMIPDMGNGILEVVRKAVKQVGKEAATHRFTLDEKNHLTDIEYTYKRQGIRTSENEVTRIAINYFIEDYRQNGEESLLAKILKRLNS
jgi:hypothetical protein